MSTHVKAKLATRAMDNVPWRLNNNDARSLFTDRAISVLSHPAIYSKSLATVEAKYMEMGHQSCVKISFFLPLFLASFLSCQSLAPRAIFKITRQIHAALLALSRVDLSILLPLTIRVHFQQSGVHNK